MLQSLPRPSRTRLGLMFLCLSLLNECREVFRDNPITFAASNREIREWPLFDQRVDVLLRAHEDFCDSFDCQEATGSAARDH